MTARPEPGTPEYDERIQRIRQRLADGPSTRARILVNLGIAVFFVLPAVTLIVSATRKSCDCNMTERSLMLAFAAALLVLPGRVVFVIVRRRMQTGHWTMRPTPGERLRVREKWAASSPLRSKMEKWTDWIFILLECELVLLSAAKLWEHLKPGHAPWTIHAALMSGVWVWVFAYLTTGLYKKATKRFIPTHNPDTP